jgi:aspartate aminotransferase-like enzyme
MKTYRIPMVPGPTSVHEKVLAAYNINYGSGDLEPEYYELYASTQSHMQKIMGTRNPIAIMSGEGMVTLWGALKSCLKPNDRVLCIGTGVFGYGIGDMARSITKDVHFVEFSYDQICKVQRVEDAIMELRPKMVTMVHCETPSGTLNPVAQIGELIRMHGVPLFYVDAVASVGGVPMLANEWAIDLCLAGTQKCLSCVPDLGMLSVSDRAWDIIKSVGYQGYDALAPWRTALANQWLPYTPSWHGLAALHTSCGLLLDEGLDNVFERHAKTAQICRNRALDMGVELFPRREEYCSPTVTALKVPSKIGWKELDRRLRESGMVAGGSLEKLAGQVFRIGHMGTQANAQLVEEAMDILQASLSL